MPEVDEDVSTGSVIVPRMSNPLSHADYSELTAVYSPLRHSDAFGIDIYRTVVITPGVVTTSECRKDSTQILMRGHRSEY